MITVEIRCFATVVENCTTIFFDNILTECYNGQVLLVREIVLFLKGDILQMRFRARICLEWHLRQINRIEVERMAVQQADINKVRASVSGQLGNKVMIQLDRGRNRVDIQEGVIKGAYPSVFTILVDDENDRNPPQLLSFSYADVLTRDIRMKLC